MAATASGAQADTTLPTYVGSYGQGSVPGFYNVLPPGENGTDNAAQFLNFTTTGTRPPNSFDQMSLYENLLYAAPNLTPDQIPNYYLDATTGVQSENVKRVEQPAAGVTIIRDQHDIPHIYGATRADTEFGAGYVSAEDRLFLMDVLRHTAEASLASFDGGSAGNIAMDQAQWTIAPYNQSDLQQQIDNASTLYGAQGRQLIEDVDAYVNGINAYIAAAKRDISLMPFEYTAVNQPVKDWQPTDVVAIASLIGAIFGKGGGNEVNSALTEQVFERRFGKAAGRVAWENFRETNDPQAPTTVAKPFPYETGSPFAPQGLATPVGSVNFVSPGGTNPENAQLRRGHSVPAAAKASVVGYTDTPHPVAIPADGSLGSALLSDLYGQKALASNWELVNAAHSADGHAIAVMGPQVGYYAPQILLEEDLHGPGLDASGAAFPGVSMYVELGHGDDYAWSATTATSDNVDTFAEVLCNPAGGAPSADSTYYLYKGKCVAMQALTRQESWRPSLDSSAPAGSTSFTTYRTVHGLVFARGQASVGNCKTAKVPAVDCIGGKRAAVAYVTARSTYMHEADSAMGFADFNNPSVMQTPKDFQWSASHINFAFNWAYVNAKHIAYFESGWYPQRAKGSSADFPILGTGNDDWLNWNTTYWTEKDIPDSQHPQAIDPTYLVSWNNKQAPKWASADDNYGYSALYRSQLISDHLDGDLQHGQKVNIAQLVQAMDLAATEDIRIEKLWPLLSKVIGTPADPTLRDAVAKLDAWYQHGGHRWDLTKSGSYADNAAIELMDAWWPKLLTAEFQPRLGVKAFSSLQNMLGLGSVYTDQAPNEPDFAQGWYGYVYKDLEDLLAAKQNTAARAAHSKHRVSVPGAFSKVYCGDGSFGACRQVLQSSLSDALKVSAQTMYGHGICAKNAQPSCFDQDESTEGSAVTVPPFPFQNRPTFQQVVELTQGESADQVAADAADASPTIDIPARATPARR